MKEQISFTQLNKDNFSQGFVICYSPVICNGENKFKGVFAWQLNKIFLESPRLSFLEEVLQGGLFENQIVLLSEFNYDENYFTRFKNIGGWDIYKSNVLINLNEENGLYNLDFAMREFIENYFSSIDNVKSSLPEPSVENMEDIFRN